MSDDPVTRLRENAVGVVTMAVTGIWLAGLFLGASWWLAALILGYVVVIPLTALLFGDEADRREWWDWGGESWEETEDEQTEPRPTTDREESAHRESGGASWERNDGAARGHDNREALETLRDRYARGELTDDQFDRKLERLLETETIEDADEWARERRRGEAARERYDRERQQEDRARDGDREPEFET